MTWLAGYQRILIPGALGGTHRQRVTKLLWHTTEGSTVEGAVGAYTQRRVPPHLTVDPSRGRLTQHVPLDRAAYALHAVDQTGVIQVEIVGFARDTHQWPAETLAWLGRNVAAPIMAVCPGIDRYRVLPTYTAGDRLPGPGVLATASSPIRLNRQQWDAYTGQLGHQHAPQNDHWDPGRLDLAAIAAAARAELGAPQPTPPPSAAPVEEDVMQLVYVKGERPGETGVQELWAINAPHGWVHLAQPHTLAHYQQAFAGKWLQLEWYAAGLLLPESRKLGAL